MKNETPAPEAHILDESGLACSCYARFSTRWEAQEHAGISTGGPMEAFAATPSQKTQSGAGEIDLLALASVIHDARFDQGRASPSWEPFENERHAGKVYCLRIANAVHLHLAALATPPAVQGDAIERWKAERPILMSYDNARQYDVAMTAWLDRRPALAQPDTAAMVEALRPFAKVMADIITNREDDETIDDSLAADRITWGDLRRAHAAFAKAAL